MWSHCGHPQPEGADVHDPSGVQKDVFWKTPLFSKKMYFRKSLGVYLEVPAVLYQSRRPAYLSFPGDGPTCIFRVFCGNSAEDSQRSKSISQWLGLHFERSQHASEVLQAFFPLNSENFVFLPLDEFLVLLNPSHNRKQQNCLLWSELMRICGRYVFFVRLTAGRYETFATFDAFFCSLGRG